MSTIGDYSNQSYVQALWNTTAGANWTQPIPWTYSEPPEPDYATLQRQRQILAAWLAGHNQRKEEKPPMRGLFEVFVVEPETDEVSGPYLVVAADEAKARLKALTKLGRDFDFDSVDVVCRRVGDVRAKKVVQEVRTVP